MSPAEVALMWVGAVTVGLLFGIVLGRVTYALAERRAARQSEKRWTQFQAAAERETR